MALPCTLGICFHFVFCAPHSQGYDLPYLSDKFTINMVFPKEEVVSALCGEDIVGKYFNIFRLWVSRIKGKFYTGLLVGTMQIPAVCMNWSSLNKDNKMSEILL